MADADFLNVELVSGGGRLNLDVTFHQEQDTEGEYSEMFCISLEEETSSAVVTKDTATPDRKSTRLNSSHQIISYAVFCLKKKKKQTKTK